MPPTGFSKLGIFSSPPPSGVGRTRSAPRQPLPNFGGPENSDRITSGPVSLSVLSSSKSRAKIVSTFSSLDKKSTPRGDPLGRA